MNFASRDLNSGSSGRATRGVVIQGAATGGSDHTHHSGQNLDKADLLQDKPKFRFAVHIGTLFPSRNAARMETSDHGRLSVL
jgi:hypothetical protein